MGVCILPGARLGDGCIVGAGGVVTGELEPYCVAVGNPARVIRSLIRVLFLQQQPCVRALKYAAALRTACPWIHLGFAHQAER
jgi:serine acetyltransferase